MLDLDAGKYADFVWRAYAVTAIVFVAMIAASLAFAGRWRRRAEALKAAQDAAGRDAAE